ncbi:hypothetical protein R3P38DRAFT_2590840 [Favolaschia claudopus]|uniref:DNA binding HTH domain-containing protein n=1 Tax=Favolaschia claudopus TaxID=2862362 RepID=A0AAV9Z1D8_9AGAR
MSSIPETLPSLPSLPQNLQNGWSANVLLAYQSLERSFNHGHILLNQENGDHVRLTLASESIVNDAVPLLQRLEVGMPQSFTHQCAHAFGPLACELQLTALAAQGIDRANVAFLDPVEEVHTGRRGRPEKRVDEDFLKEAFAPGRNVSKTGLAAALGIHRSVLHKKLKAAGIGNR